jgi:hydroxyacylglutathione hydrolase
MKLKVIPVGVYAANCYIVMDEITSEALVIDPGAEAEKLIAAIKKMNAKIKYIFLTHGHVDHTEACVQLKNEFNVPICINSKDEEYIKKGEYMFGSFGKADILLKESDTFSIGSMNVKCIETPGHTLGGMSFLVDDILFSGDTLFDRSIGRTDFTGGNFDTIINSIKEKLLILPDDTIVYPGHGPSTSIIKEKMMNRFL